MKLWFNLIRKKTYHEIFSEGLAAGRRVGEEIGREQARRELTAQVDEAAQKYREWSVNTAGIIQGLRERIAELEAKLNERGMKCKRCGHVLRDHVPFGAADRKPGVCCGVVAAVR